MKMDKYVIITSLKSESTYKLINRIPGSCLLISSLPGSALRTHVESLVLEALPGKLDVKLEDLKVLMRSPDLLNNVKIGQGQLQLIMEQI